MTTPTPPRHTPRSWLTRRIANAAWAPDSPRPPITTGRAPGPDSPRPPITTGRTSDPDSPWSPITTGRTSGPEPRIFSVTTGRARGPFGGSSGTGCAVARTALGAAIGLLADRLLGEPPAPVHPVRAFGTTMAALERRLWRDSRPAGALYTAAGAALGAAAGAGLALGTRIARRRNPDSPAASSSFLDRTTRPPDEVIRPKFAGPLRGPSVAGGAVATWLVVAGRALADEAGAIGDRLTADDLEGARQRLPALVGRDPDSLDAKGAARAVVESVAENTVDAVVAPACWAALGGAPGAGFYRAVNTLDAMVGHRNERYLRFGWASARLDDVANWIPARLTVLLVAAVRPRQARDVLGVLVHPPAHPSPNAGVAEAAFAAALGLRLGGDTVYAGRVDPRPTFGAGRSPEPPDIAAATRLSRDVTLALAAVLATPAAVRALRSRRLAPAVPSPGPAS